MRGRAPATSPAAAPTTSSTTAFGPGANGPLVIAVELRGDDGAPARVASAVAADPGIATVQPVQVNPAGDTAVVIATPTTGPQDQATVDLIHHLRDDVVPDAVGGTAARTSTSEALVASYVDESELMGRRLPVFIAAVIALSFLLLLIVFRSLLVALKAAVMNVLAIGAAYGVMAVALSGGRLGELIGITEPTPDPGVAPDDDVRHAVRAVDGLRGVPACPASGRSTIETGDNATAVAHGIARTGRVISAAAAIMVTVFGAFMLGDQVLMKVIGLGLAVAVLLDATVVRMVLVPSTMELLGDRNWWLPRWLDRRLPHLDVEGGHADRLDEELGTLLEERPLERV